jgi:hypothetical protein
MLSVQIMDSDRINNRDLLSRLTMCHTGSTAYMAISPNLQSFELGLDYASINYELFVDMVESHWCVPAEGSLCCCLCSVEVLDVDGKNVLDAPMEQKLDVLKGEGLRVSLLKDSEARSKVISWRV